MGAPATKLSELELADRARAGDEPALVQLYRQHREPLFRHAFRMLGDESAALDMVQEAFARAIPAIARTREELNFRAWIYRIVTNLCLRELNRRTRMYVRPVAEDAAEVSPRPPARRGVGQQLAAALERLPDRYRQILLLRELEELSYLELAAVLELSEGNVKVLLHRARTRFAALFIAERLVAEPETEVPCDELTGLLRSTPARRQLEQHLEGCASCRQLEGRPNIELLGLLPVPPVPVFPELSVGGELGGAGNGAAPGGVASSSSAFTVALAVGAMALVGVIAAGIVIIKDMDSPAPARTEEAGSLVSSAPDKAGDKVAKRAELRPAEPSMTGKGSVTPAREQSHTTMRAISTDSEPARGKRDRRRRHRRPKVPAKVKQAVDRESPPSGHPPL